MKCIKTNSKIISVILLCAMFFSLSACEMMVKKHESQLFAMDTFMMFTAYGKNGKKGVESAADVIVELEKMLDPEKEGSDVYRLNSNPGEFVEVSEDIYELLEVASDVHSKSDGALDPTIYNLVKAWGFIKDDYRIPGSAEISELLENPGMEGIQVKSINGQAEEKVEISLTQGVQLTFGAIAKGYASQKAIEALREAGVDSAIISLGGNVQTLGTKPGGEPWSVAIQDPNDSGDYVGYMKLGETAAVTSGGYQRYFVQDGIIYHHILDPKTGYPSDSGLLSVSVICENGTLADALSTALFVLGEEKALEYYHTYGGFELVLVTDDGRVVVTPGLKDKFVENGNKYIYEYL